MRSIFYRNFTIWQTKKKCFFGTGIDKIKRKLIHCMAGDEFHRMMDDKSKDLFEKKRSIEQFFGVKLQTLLQWDNDELETLAQANSNANLRYSLDSAFSSTICKNKLVTEDFSQNIKTQFETYLKKEVESFF